MGHATLGYRPLLPENFRAPLELAKESYNPMWISTYEPDRELVLNYAPGEEARSRGCALGCLTAACIPTAIVGAATLSTGYHDGQFFFVWAPLLLSAVALAFRLRSTAPVDRVRVTPDGITQYGADDRAVESIDRSDMGVLRMTLRGKDPMRGDIRISTGASRSPESDAQPDPDDTVSDPARSKKSRRRSATSLDISVDGLGGQEQFKDFAHRVARILGFERVAYKLTNDDDATELDPDDTSDYRVHVEYRGDAPHEIPTVGEFKSYGTARRRSAELLTDWGSTDLDESVAREAEVIDEPNRLALAGPPLSRRIFRRSSLLLVGLTVGFGWLLWIALTQFEPRWLGSVLAFFCGVCCAGTSGIWATSILTWSRRVLSVDRQARELALRVRQVFATIPFDSIRFVVIDGREPQSIYLDTDRGLVSTALHGSKRARLAVAHRAAELIGVPCQYCEEIQ